MATRAVLKVGLHVVQVTQDNIDKLAVYLGGIVDEGVLSFTANRDHDYKWYAVPTDWIMIYDTNDVVVLPDSMVQRLYSLEEDDTMELIQELPEDALTRKDLEQGVDKK